ncbi:MAG TPA: LysE family transporter [Patescibacteria group bacterium]|nr:LysE family transporter [Patescibacteria group bacterium]
MSSLLLKGFAFGFAIAASPGPIFFLCVRRTLVRGRLYGLVSGFGVATADAFYGAIATFGVAAVATAIASGRRPLAVLGGVVLIALGAKMLFERRQALAEVAPPTRRGLAWAYASTLALTITNPATIISFAALAATLGLGTGGDFVKPASVVLGVLAGSATWWCVLAVVASRLRSRMTPGVVRAVSAFSGLVIVVLGLAALVSAWVG